MALEIILQVHDANTLLAVTQAVRARLEAEEAIPTFERRWNPAPLSNVLGQLEDIAAELKAESSS